MQYSEGSVRGNACEARKNRIAIDMAIAFACFLGIYGLLIFRFGPFTDEIWDQTRDVHGWYTACGRWGLALYRNIMSYRYVPFAYGIACAVYMSAAIALQTCLLKLPDLKQRLFYIAASLGIVQLSYMMIASHHVDAVCLGILLATCATYITLYKGKNVWWGACAALALAFAISTYQSLILLPFCLLGGYFLLQKQWPELRQVWPILLRLVLISIAGLAIYYTINHFACKVVSGQTLAGVQNYQSGLVAWGQLPLGTHLLHIGKQFALHLAGMAYPGEWLYATAAVPVGILLIKLVRSNGAASTKTLYVGFVLGLYIGPFTMLAALGEDAGARLHFTSPMACGLLWLAAAAHCNIIKKAPLWVVSSICAFVLLKASYTVSDMAYLQKRMFDEAVSQIAEIQQYAWQTPLPDGVDAHKCPVVIAGHIPNRLEDPYSSCVSTMESGNKQNLYDYLGYGLLKDARRSKHTEERLREELSTMQAYPAKGCTRYVDGEILVKLPGIWY